MPGTGFEVRFTGKLAEGAVPKEVLQNLCTLFKAEPEKVKALFSRADAVVWRGGDRALATRLVAAVEKAGALCRMEELAPPEAAPESVASGQTPAREGTSPGAGVEPLSREGEAAVRTTRGEIVPKLGRLDMSLVPVNCIRISAVPDGLGTGRKDCPELSWRELFLACVFKTSDEKDEYRLLLFTTRQKRPLAVDCNAIAYNEFAGVTGGNMLSSLRAFLKHLQAMHPGFLFDRDTGRFLEGAPPLVYTKDATVLATALYAAVDPPAAPLPAKAQHPAQPGPLPRQAASPDVRAYFSSKGPSPAEQTQTWSARLSLAFSLLLVGGFFWPLLKRSLLFGSDQLVWSWTLMGAGMDAKKAAAMATVSTAVSYLPWALVPLLTAVLTLAVRAIFSGIRRHLGFLVVGAASTTLLFTVFVQESEVYGLMLIPPTRAGGTMVLITVLCGSFIAATNHVRKTLPEEKLLRGLSGVGGAGVVLATLLAIFGSDWSGWGIYLLYCLMLLVGGLGLLHAFKEDPGEESLKLVSLGTRALLAWAPCAAVITQSHTDSAFVEYVISAGGGTGNIAMSAIKSFAVYYGCAFVLALGLAGVLTDRLAPEQDREI